MVLEVNQVRKVFQLGNDTKSIEALKGVSFKVNPGEFISIMGPSGSGKSTLLQILGTLDKPTSGEIKFNGQLIKNQNDHELSQFRRQKLGFIFQFFNLVPTLTALENITIPALLDKKSAASVTPKALELLKLVNLESRAQHWPHQLSGGEMQRIAIARALINSPLLILADEPTGNLDSKTGASILKFLQNLVLEHHHTLIMVTHDPKAAQYGTRLIQLKDGNIESDTPVTPMSTPGEPHDQSLPLHSY